MNTDNKSLENKQTEDILAENSALVSKVAPQGIIIGGTNLITGSKDYAGWANNNNPEIIPNAYKNFTAYRKLGSYGSRYYYKKVAEANDTITVSFYAKYVSGGTYTIVFMNGNSIQKYVYFPANPTVGTWYRLSVTTTVNVDIYSLKIEEAPPYVGIEFCAIKLELGNIPTDWSPAPEDVKIDISLEIDKIQIGGRNYIRNSYNTYAIDATIYWQHLPLVKNDLITGETYILSFKTVINDGVNFMLTDTNNNGAQIIYPNIPFTLNQPKQYFAFTNNGFGQKASICEIQLEKGNKPTDWTPAPEDSTYEEGTWTPVVEGSNTQGVAQYTVNNARYVRTGNMITAFFDTSGKFTTTPTGTCVIKGLPYKGGNNANGLLTLGIGYAEQNVYFNIEGNTLVSKKQNGKNSDIVAAVFGTDLSNTNFHLYGNVSYFIA